MNVRTSINGPFKDSTPVPMIPTSIIIVPMILLKTELVPRRILKHQLWLAHSPSITTVFHGLQKGVFYKEIEKNLSMPLNNLSVFNI